MSFQSFGKIAIRADAVADFVKEATAKGLTVRNVQGNIYEFGMVVPSMLNPVELRKVAGSLGLKYGDF